MNVFTKRLLGAAASFALLIVAPGAAKAKEPGGLTRPNVFGSVALPVKQTRFDARWQRAFRSTAPTDIPVMLRVNQPSGQLQKLGFVNATLNGRIRYRFDTDASGDSWALARDTFSQSAGDCEDIVIAKMQALRSLGVPASNLYMSIGQDVAVGAVHAVLLVRVGKDFWVLDNRTNGLIAHDKYTDFHPILTFSGSSVWVHGYKLGETPPAVQQLSIALNSAGQLPLGNNKASASGTALLAFSGVSRH